jgi:uncharacterized protein YybS (DUF2232 family)
MVKDIVNGVLMASLLFGVSIFFPLFGFFCALFIPLPILYYRFKLDRFKGTLIPVFSLTLAAAVLGRVDFDLFFFAELLLVGWILGEMLLRRATLEKTALAACGAVATAGLIALLAYGSLTGTAFYQTLSEYVVRNVELSLQLYREMGVSEDSIRLISESIDSIRYVLVGIIPSLVVVYTLLVVWLNLLLARPLLRIRGLASPGIDNLKNWQAPENLVWAVIGCGILLLVPDGTIKLIGANGLLVVMTIYFFQGIAITAFFFDRKNLPRPLRILLYSLIAVQQLLVLAVIGLGLFDVWLNLRKIDPSSDDPGQAASG